MSEPMQLIEEGLDWQPISTAPEDTRLLLWWVPDVPNPYAECWIIGQVSSHRPGFYWDGQYCNGQYEDGYKPLGRIKFWQPLPPSPHPQEEDRRTE